MTRVLMISGAGLVGQARAGIFRYQTCSWYVILAVASLSGGDRRWEGAEDV